MSKDWKQGLLSSGFPLEYEVSNILLNADFHVEGEQPYTRRTQSGVEEFSVDLSANHFVPIPGVEGDSKGELTVICECKYRTPNKEWLFMPDLNELDFAPTWPAALRDFPTFTTYSYDFNPVIDFCVNPTRAMKGVEVHTSGGEAFDKDIRHACNQLRYAIPGVILKHLWPLTFSPVEDCEPFFILPILVTNSPLRILRHDVDLKTIQAAEKLGDISTEVDVVDVRSPYAEDFREHCLRVFSVLTENKLRAESTHKVFPRIEEFYRAQGSFKSPFVDLELIRDGRGFEPGLFSQFPVVNLNALPKFLNEAKQAAALALRESKQVVFADKPKA